MMSEGVVNNAAAAEEIEVVEAPKVGAYNLNEKLLEASTNLEVETTIDDRPLIIRITDKNWKTRSTAYDDLKKELLANPTKTELFTEFSEHISKMTSDSNASSLDSGLDTAIVFADLAPNGFMKPYADKLSSNVVEKAFGTRPGTQNKGKQLILKLMEIDDPLVCTAYLLTKLADKRPKVPPMCLEVIKEGIIAFGARCFPVKEVIASLGAVFNGTNSAARDMSMELILEMSKWIGIAPFNSLLESIRAVQKTEFEKAIIEREAQGPLMLVPTVWLRSQRPPPGSGTIGQLAKSSINADCREFLEDIDLPRKLKTTDYAVLIADEKWSEQLKALSILIDILGPTPKIKAGCDVSDVVNTCKTFLRQGHVQLQVSSLKVISLLCNGLRAEFSSIARNTVEGVLSKAKEKRLVSEVQLCIHSMLKFCIAFDAISDDLIEQVLNKKSPPHARVGLMELANQGINELPEKFPSEYLKPLAEALAGCFEDSDPKVRDTSATTLATVAQLVRKRGKSAAEAQKYLATLEHAAPRLFKKLQTSGGAGSPPANTEQGIDPSTSVPPQSLTTSNTAAKTAAPSKSQFSSSLPRKPSSSSLTNTSGSGVSSKQPTTQAAASAAGSSQLTSKKATIGSKDSPEDDNVEDLAMSPEDAESVLSGLQLPGWEGSFQTSMASTKWQDKAEAITLLGQKIAETESGGQYSAALTVYLSAKTGAFRISNVNILKAVMHTACEAAKHTGSTRFSRPAAWELIRSFGDKYADKKTKELVDSLLVALSAALQPSFVVKRMKVVMDKVKAPLAHQHYLEWIRDAVPQFGVGNFPVPFVASFCQAEMENKDGKVRGAAVEVMGAMFHQIGPRFNSVAISDEMKPQMVSLLEAEFARVGHDPTLAGAKASNSGHASGDSVIPRQDLCSLVDKNILTELNFCEGKTSWMNRKAALESLITACERSGHYLDGTKNTGEIVRALKPRLNDTQANLKPIAASAIGHIIASLDLPNGVKMLRLVAEGFLGGLSENKKPIRDATVSALQMAVTLNNTDPAAVADPQLLGVLVAPIGEALTATVIGRQELLSWLLPHAESLRPDHNCAELFTVPLVTCLQDKTASVRAVAEQMLTALMTRNLVSKNTLDKAVRDLPPANKRALQPYVEKLMNANPSGAGMKKPIEEVAEPSSSSTITSLSAHSRTGVPANTKPTGAITAAPTIQTELLANDSTVDTSWILRKNTGKARRLDDSYRTNWPQPPEEPSEHELIVLRAAWEPYLAPEFVNSLFPDTKRGPLNQDSVSGIMNDLCTQLDSPPTIWLSHTDFLIRYLSCCLCMRETGPGMIRVLQALLLLFLHMKTEGYILHEFEVSCVLPHIIDKSGHKSDRHKALFKQVLAAAAEVVSPVKMNQALLQGLTSKNKKSRVVCVEELQRMVEVHGANSLGKAGVREVGQFLDSKDQDTAGRSACLDLGYALYVAIGSDLPKLLRVMGESLSDRSSSMLEDRIKQKSKLGLSAAAASNRERDRDTDLASTISTSSRQSGAAGKDSPLHTSLSRSQSVTPSKTRHSTGTTATAASTHTAHLTDEPSLYSPRGRTNSAGWQGSTATTPVLDRMRDSQFVKPHAVTESSTLLASVAVSSKSVKGPVELSSVYLDIFEKMDTYLACGSEAVSSVSEECRDYVKILHALISGEWAAETTDEDEQMLLSAADRIAVKLTRSIALAMNTQGAYTSASGGTSASALSLAESQLHMDVALVAVLIATLFALVKRKPLLEILSAPTTSQIYEVCIHALVHPRLTAASTGAHVDQDILAVAKQILKGINTVILRLATDMPSDRSLVQLIPFMSRCTQASAQLTGSTLSEIAQPLSRLVRRVVLLETQAQNPFKQPHSAWHRVLESLHEYFNLIPSLINGPDNDKTFISTSASPDLMIATAQTVLSEIVQALGRAHTLGLLQVANLPSSAIIYSLTLQYSMAEEAAIRDREVAERRAQTDELQARVNSIVQEITAARDKTVPIAKLHEMRKQHPELDIHANLQQISSAFRRFVTDNLAKLDKAEVADENLNSAVNMVTAPTAFNTSLPTPVSALYPTQLTQPGTPVTPSARVVAVAAASSATGEEAMRILEGLINKPTARASPSGLTTSASPMSQQPLRTLNSNIPTPHQSRAPGSASGVSVASPRFKATERVRDSLSTLTSSLDLPTTEFRSSKSLQSNGAVNVEDNEVSISTQVVNSPSGTENLAARLAKLRSKASEL